MPPLSWVFTALMTWWTWRSGRGGPGSLRGTEDYIMIDPMVSDNLKLFLRFTLGAQWQYKLNTPVGGGVALSVKSLSKRLRALSAV